MGKVIQLKHYDHKRPTMSAGTLDGGARILLFTGVRIERRFGRGDGPGTNGSTRRRKAR